MTQKSIREQPAKYCLNEICKREIAEMTGQNIYLFFEQNDGDQRRIDSKLVTLYMNRFVIDEEKQNEITGVDYLKKIDKVNFRQNVIRSANFHEKSREFRDKFVYDIYWKWWRSQLVKLNYDTEIINAALLKSNQLEPSIYDLHFIIGSSYYMGFYTRNWFPEEQPMMHFPDPDELPEQHPDEFFEPPGPPHPIEKLIKNIITKYFILDFSILFNFGCTFLSGLNFSFCTKSQFKQAYHTETAIESEHAIVSVDNDLETFYESLMISDYWEKFCRKFDTNQYQELFSFQFVEDYEQVNFLDELYCDHSYSVGANPEIMQDLSSFQMHSYLLDPYSQPSAVSKCFFPPMRDPHRLQNRQDLKSSIQIFYIIY